MDKQTKGGSGELLRALKEALEEKKLQIQKGVLLWAANNLPRYPWRQFGKTPYEVLIGEVWLKETNSIVAVRIYHRFLERFISIRALVEAREDDLANVLSSFHLEQHSQRIRVLSESLLRQGKGGMPRDSESFLKASGLEHHSIRAIMCFGYNLPVAVIDSNAVRMLSRLFSHTLPPRPAQGLLQAVGESLLPDNNPQCYNCGLLDLAELICRYEDPLCTQCPVGKVCDYAGSSS